MSLIDKHTSVVKITPKDCFVCDKRFTDIKAVIGIGNPGQKFVGTRHNAGFIALDALADKFCVSWQSNAQSEQFNYKYQSVDREVTFYKPQTFVNNTGDVAKKLKSKGFSSEQIMVVYDDLEKAKGFVGVKIGGSAKGHNGIKSMIQAMGFDFWRLPIGIGRPNEGEAVNDYVLSRFSPVELPEFNLAVETVVNFFDCSCP